MKDLVIRKATKNDLDCIVDLASQLYQTEQPFDKNIKDGYYYTEKGKEGLLKDIKSRKRIFLVAELDDKVIGFIDGYIFDKEDVHIEKVAYLDRISVDEKFKHKGIGQELIDVFTTKIKNKNAKYIKLNAFPNNYPAISLYNKNGFEEYSVFYMKRID